ncbi:MAG: DUF4918 family protein [Bacteroidia bacterium]|jgi:hypothetical protein|nr:DUF4918 family protein [Bacteroidia bacterium]
MKHNGSFAEKNIRFLNGLKFSGDLPEGVEVLVPYKNPAVKEAVRAYYSSFYDDPAERIFMFGINPGRFGSGITGISFTDPIRLKAIAGIDHSFEMKGELSSEFIYAMIEAYGGLKEFASRFFLTAVCPLGFTLNGKNYNYYDDPDLESAVRPFVLKTMQQQIKIGASRKVAVCIGEGDNFKYFNGLNLEQGWFERIVALPHPRWVMQYRRKQLATFINRYVETLQSLEEELKNH